MGIIVGGLIKGLEGILKLALGKDKYAVGMLIGKGAKAKVRKKDGHVWADYFFIAACYAATLGDEAQKEQLIAQIQKGFPNYNPSTRFTWERPESIDQFVTVTPVIGQMNQFCEAHPDFSFSNEFSGYFPNVDNMSINKENLSKES